MQEAARSGAAPATDTSTDTATVRAEAYPWIRLSPSATDIAANRLSDAHPHLSARGGLANGQRAGAWSLLGAAAVFLFSRPDALWQVLEASIALVFSGLVLFRLAASLSALIVRPTSPKPLADADLPRLTYLAPLYREANIAAQLVRAIEAVDYPRDRLEVLFLTEEDDVATRTALIASGLPGHMQVVVCPPGHPRTKPRALNCGLQLATGDLIAVLDAEDRPNPAQPRAAAAAFNGRPRLGVVQAPLLAHNPEAGWITRQFAVEYAVHFLVWLPFLARLNLPMALGGTSNYFRRSVVVRVGGWDAWNVTEDADLGLRLARRGFEADVILPPTLEEAPVRFGHWLSQRTRWLKGHIQTFLVLTRNPFAAAWEMGPARCFVAQAMLGGGLLSALLHGPMLAWMFAAFFLPGAQIEGWQAALLGAGYGSVAAAALASKRPLLTAGVWLTWPLYWMLMSLAMTWALIEMKLRPHHWSKTPHGVRRRTPLFRRTS
jgi:cellulose synthase/poly-beta-1,6-N-acetylglucosamine synthase-like glycosyltransferase